MPDGTSRFTTLDGTTLYHFMGTSTFAEYTVRSFTCTSTALITLCPRLERAQAIFCVVHQMT
jgi:Zn-dependent alcohol dehydrogenase